MSKLCADCGKPHIKVGSLCRRCRIKRDPIGRYNADLLIGFLLQVVFVTPIVVLFTGLGAATGDGGVVLFLWALWVLLWLFSFGYMAFCHCEGRNHMGIARIPAIAFILGFLWPGLGFIYNGRISLGLALMLGILLSNVLALLLPPLLLLTLLAQVFTAFLAFQSCDTVLPPEDDQP